MNKKHWLASSFNAPLQQCHQQQGKSAGQYDHPFGWMTAAATSATDAVTALHPAGTARNILAVPRIMTANPVGASSAAHDTVTNLKNIQFPSRSLTSHQQQSQCFEHSHFYQQPQDQGSNDSFLTTADYWAIRSQLGQRSEAAISYLSQQINPSASEQLLHCDISSNQLAVERGFLHAQYHTLQHQRQYDFTSSMSLLHHQQQSRHSSKRLLPATVIPPTFPIPYQSNFENHAFIANHAFSHPAETLITEQNNLGSGRRRKLCGDSPTSDPLPKTAVETDMEARRRLIGGISHQWL